MITNFSNVEELSPSQAETISGGQQSFPVPFGQARYIFTETDDASTEDDWTVTFVRGKRRDQFGDDVFTYRARYIR
ncbi:MAG: hypothetical protein RM338_28545 [Nostoc sp. DedQUE12a]|nr:hypothetical protein [Nostoc sp. DedQUE12a]